MDETEEAGELELERMKYTVLAGNIELYKNLFPDKDEEEEEIQWVRPESAEDIEAILRDYARVQQDAVPISE